METPRICKHCIWWQEFHDRVHACISSRPGNIGTRGKLELRKCRNTPPPSVEVVDVYTDENFSCGSHAFATHSN